MALVVCTVVAVIVVGNMYCTNANFVPGIGFVECRKCHACRINKKKELSDRLRIERRYHKHAYFVTLTYSPENYPEDECLNKEHLKKYFKRLLKSVGSAVCFGVGEYGDETGRAHYHAAIFSDIPIFQAIIDAWSLHGCPIGRVSVDQLSNGRCKYIAGYVVKKMDKMDDERLDGRTPEFRITPRRPPLGYGLLYELLEFMASNSRFRHALLSHIYAPYSVRIGGDTIRLPRYVRDKLKVFYSDPIHKKKQQALARLKAAQDSYSVTQLTKDMQVLCGLDSDFRCFKSENKELFEKMNELNELAYNKRKDRKL
ncbi:replication initiator protein [Dipodfec virus UOA04_Rod_962]|nr:replication initiator protein [Dipodfec virus UOA04_Rod_962]